MKLFERIVLIVGLATIGILLWRFEPGRVWALVSPIGLVNFLIILSCQFCDQTFNSFAWRFCFPKSEAAGLPFVRLFMGRVAGDGVNYLTPSGTVGGEFIRPGILGGIRSDDVKNASAAIGKFAQSIGQAFFVCLGFAFILPGKIAWLTGWTQIAAVTLACIAILFLVASLYTAASDQFFSLISSWAPKIADKISPLRLSMKSYLTRHPGRFAFAVLLFSCGYSCGALEVFVACRFMGIAMPAVTALCVEVLSNTIEGMLFFVPAKLGTQEADKTAIFHLLGYSAAQGLAFGLIRHVREFVWSSAGFAIFAVNRRKERQPPTPAGPQPLSRPLAP